MMEKVVLPEQRPRRTEEEISQAVALWAADGRKDGRRRNVITSLEPRVLTRGGDRPRSPRPATAKSRRTRPAGKRSTSKAPTTSSWPSAPSPASAPRPRRWPPKRASRSASCAPSPSALPVGGCAQGRGRQERRLSAWSTNAYRDDRRRAPRSAMTRSP